MSDRYYGEVAFPEWACKYIPQLREDGCIAKTDDGKTVIFTDEEAKDGIPWICEELNDLNIPYDCRSSEYFEYSAEKIYIRFRDEGKIEQLVVVEDDKMVAAQDVLTMIKERRGNSHPL